MAPETLLMWGRTQQGITKAFESLEEKKPSVRFELLEGVGSEFRSKEEVICWPPAFSWGCRQRQKSPFSAAHNGSLLRCTKPSSFVLKGPADLPSVRPGLFCFPPRRFTVVDISKVFIVGPTVNPFQGCVRAGLGWGGLCSWCPQSEFKHSACRA